MAMTLHSGQMKPDNWDVIFTAYIRYEGGSVSDDLYRALVDLRTQGRHHMFDGSNGVYNRLWMQHEDDAALILLKFSR